MPPIFDPSLYATVPTRTPATTLSLARGLLAAVSPEPDERVAKRIAKLRKAAKLLQTAWVEAGSPSAAGEDPRPFDAALDRSWGALRTRLEGCVQLGDDELSPRASTLMTTLFPTGLAFATRGSSTSRSPTCSMRCARRGTARCTTTRARNGTPVHHGSTGPGRCD